MKKDEASDSINESSAHIQGSYKNKKRFVVICVALILLLLLVILVNIWTGNKHRSESYKKVNGAAGLNATIVYDCDKKPCDYDFNVYILANNGQQVGVVRPDKEGRINMALPGGKYVLLIGKQLGGDNTFPQEPVELKDSQALELRLHYK